MSLSQFFQEQPLWLLGLLIVSNPLLGFYFGWLAYRGARLLAPRNAALAALGGFAFSSVYVLYVWSFSEISLLLAVERLCASVVIATACAYLLSLQEIDRTRGK